MAEDQATPFVFHLSDLLKLDAQIDCLASTGTPTVTGQSAPGFNALQAGALLS